MTRFRCVSIDTGTALRFRQDDLDDGGNRLIHHVASAMSNMPCRHCLELGRPGETMLLGSYRVPCPSGIYQSSSPIFLHQADCPRFAVDNQIAPIVLLNPLISLRSYDADECCIYDLGVVCAGDAAEGPLLRALEDERTVFVNIHTARPGCLLSHVEKLAN